MVAGAWALVEHVPSSTYYLMETDTATGLRAWRVQPHGVSAARLVELEPEGKEWLRERPVSELREATNSPRDQAIVQALASTPLVQQEAIVINVPAAPVPATNRGESAFFGGFVGLVIGAAATQIPSLQPMSDSMGLGIVVVGLALGAIVGYNWD